MLSFEKYQGLGNDFVLIDRTGEPFEQPDPRFIQLLCDRRLGIGADGVLIFARSEPPAAVGMIYFNADGARAETCFNGLRCIALHAARTGVVKRGEDFIIATDAGGVRAKVVGDGALVRTEMPGPIFAPEQVPVQSKQDVIDAELAFSFGTLAGTALSLGNPHFVTFRNGEDLERLNDFILTYGAEVEHSPHFPHRTNFEAAVVRDGGRLELAVWERGVGRTLACGSGATAAVCAAIRTGRLMAEKPIMVTMAGGTLTIVARRDLDAVLVEGPAQWVFSGFLPPDFAAEAPVK